MGDRIPLTLVLWLGAAATLVILPTFFLGDSSGHDFEFHVASWMEVVRQWHQGILFPRWAQFSNYGFGEPRFIFYPPLSWLLGAALGEILPWRAVPDVFIWLSLVLAGASMYQLSRRWLPRNQAIAAAVLFAVNPYQLVIVYYRSDFAELLASALFPLLILKTLELQWGRWREICTFSVLFACLWLANAPAAVIASYSVALIVVANFARSRDWTSLVRAGCAILLGFALGAFYILPAAVERSWVQINTVLITNLQPWNNFVFTHAEDPEFLIFNWKVSGVALLAVAVFSISAVFVARRRAELAGRFLPLLLLAIASVGLMFPLSSAIWKYLPELAFVQFPWRWLLSLDVIAILFFTYACSRWRRPWVAWLLTGLAFSAIGGWMTTNNWWDADDVSAVQNEVTSGQGYGGVDEYVPVGSDHDDLAQDVAIVREVDPESGDPVPVDSSKIKVEQWSAEKRIVRSNFAEPVSLLVKLFPYPAWKATLNGAPISLGHGEDNGEALIELPPGQDEIQLKFGRTWDRLAGVLISLLAAAGVLLFGVSCLLFGGRLAQNNSAAFD